MDLSGRPCVVTGATRGIGRALAGHLAALGAPLVVCARSGSELADVEAELLGLGAPAVVARDVDVGDAVAVRDFAAAADAVVGPAYAVVNNAGILGPVGPVDAVDLTAWSDALRTNVVGTATVTAAFVPQLRRRGAGRVVNLSGGGLGGPGMAPNISAYTASKAAVVSLTETLAVELVDAGITVNAVAPGAQPTGFVEEIVRAGPDRAGPRLHAATVDQQGQPFALERFVALVAFLLTDGAGWLTGRLLSARWDTVETLTAHRPALEQSSLLQLRRIDDVMYAEIDPSSGAGSSSG